MIGNYSKLIGTDGIHIIQQHRSNFHPIFSWGGGIDCLISLSVLSRKAYLMWSCFRQEVGHPWWWIDTLWRRHPEALNKKDEVIKVQLFGDYELWKRNPIWMNEAMELAFVLLLGFVLFCFLWVWVWDEKSLFSFVLNNINPCTLYAKLL